MSDVYMQYANCIPVKGYSRSAFYDLQRIRYLFTTNYFVDLLLTNNYKICKKNAEIDLTNYMDSLVEEEWGIYLDQLVVNLFPELNLAWDNYAEITNCIIDLKSKESEITFFIKKILPELEKLGCKHFQINFLEPLTYREILSFLILFDDTQANCLNLVLPFTPICSEDSLELFETQPRLNYIHFYSVTNNPITNKIEQRKNIFYTAKNIIPFSIKMV